MNGHPGGETHTRRLLELSALPRGAKVLDMGAGAGEAVQQMLASGYLASGVDLSPRSPLVRQGNFLQTGFSAGSFDVVLSECSFYVSGDVHGALREAYRLLKSGGLLLLSDVFTADPSALLREAGFDILHAEDLTPQWREYYLEMLWREDDACRLPHVKCTYWIIIGRRKEDGPV